MQGRKRLSISLLLLAAAGCREVPSAVAQPTAPIDDIAASFDPKNTGAIRGSVIWKGIVPDVPPLHVHAYLDSVNANRLRGEYPNPHVPLIEPATHGVAEALIRLDRVDAGAAKPWSHQPVAVELQQQCIAVCQGDERRRIGIVRRGATVTFVNRDADFHALRARGAAFFSLPFVVADRPTSRRLDKTGLVELSEGAGLYWRRAYLVVMDHPYAAVTDRSGRFTLDQVPAGAYRLNVWLPNYHIERREHEPETAVISRLVFAPAVEVEQAVTVTADQAIAVEFVLTREHFAKRR